MVTGVRLPRLAVAQCRMDLARISAAVASTTIVVGYAVGAGLWLTTGDAWARPFYGGWHWPPRCRSAMRYGTEMLLSAT